MGSKEIGTLAMVLGILILLANLLSPNTAWDDLSAAVQNTPSFSNPFDERISQNPALIDEGTNDPDVVTNPAGVPNCSGVTAFYGCLTTRDGASSYVTDNAVDFQFNLREDSIPTNANLPVLEVIVLIQCRAVSGDSFQIILTDNNVVIQFNSLTVRCTSAEFTEVTIQNSFVPTRPLVSMFSNGYVFFVGVSSSVIDVSYISVSYIIGTEPECASADTLAYVGCLLSNFLNGVFRFFRLIVNAAVFLAQGFVYLGAILVALSGVFTVLFNLGAPSPFQEIIDIAVVGVSLVLVYDFVKTARGGGGV